MKNVFKYKNYNRINCCLAQFSKKCVIWMENNKENDEVEKLLCFHIFQKDCIEEWYINNYNNYLIYKNNYINEGV